MDFRFPQNWELMVYSAQLDSYGRIAMKYLEKYIDIKVKASGLAGSQCIYEEVGKTISEEIVLTPM